MRKKIANAAKQHAENAEGGEFVFADSVNQHADEGAADERADIHYAADKAHHHATGAERFRKAGNYHTVFREVRQQEGVISVEEI